MKSKLVGILVCMMLMTTFLTVALNVENVELNELTQTEMVTSSIDDDVPIWKVGYKWVYKIKDINIDLEENGSKVEQNKSIHVHLEIDELPLEVVDDTNDYNVKFNANLRGSYSVFIEENNSIIDIEGKLMLTTIKGNIFFDKSELGIKKVDYRITGLLTLKVNELPEDWKIPKILVAIPIPATITTTIDFDDTYTPLNFPLNASGHRWGLPTTNFTVNGKVQSFWLNILKFINDIASFLGNPLLPENISALLPVIDIKEALETRGMNNTFEIPEVPLIFSCNSMDDITVPAGNFSAYNISIAEIVGNIYYAPKVKNIIKIAGQLGDLLPFMTSIEMELVEYKLEDMGPKIPILDLQNIKGGLLGISVALANSGGATAYDIKWEMNLSEIFGFLFFPKHANGEITQLEPGEEAIIDIGLMFGLGESTVTFYCEYTMILNDSRSELDIGVKQEWQDQGYLIFHTFPEGRQPTREWRKIEDHEYEYTIVDDEKVVKFIIGPPQPLQLHNVRVHVKDSSDIMFLGACKLIAGEGQLKENWITKNMVESGDAYWEVELLDGE